jgi:hypothetical protein
MIKNLFLEFGRKFLINSADATTGLLIKLCSGDYQSIISLPLSLPINENESTKNNNNIKENSKEKDKNKSKEKDKNNNKNIENLKLSSNLIKKIALPIDDIISFFSGYEDRLFQLVVCVGNVLGSKASVTLGNTTLELYLDKLYLLKTYDENNFQNNNNNINNNINDNINDNNNNLEIRNNTKTIDLEILKTNFLLEKKENIISIEEKILTFLDGDLPYDRYVTKAENAYYFDIDFCCCYNVQSSFFLILIFRMLRM